MYCNKKCFHCLSPLEKDQCSHFITLSHLSSVQVCNTAVRHVLMCDACNVSPNGRCLGFINEHSRCEKTCKGSEPFCCDEHYDNLKLVDHDLTDDPFEDTDERDSSDRFRGRMRKALWHLSGGRCHYCRRELDPHNWHADHKQPVALGGRTTLANGVAACPSCNREKGTKPYQEFCTQKGIRPQ